MNMVARPFWKRSWVRGAVAVAVIIIVVIGCLALASSQDGMGVECVEQEQPGTQSPWASRVKFRYSGPDCTVHFFLLRTNQNGAMQMKPPSDLRVAGSQRNAGLHLKVQDGEVIEVTFDDWWEEAGEVFFYCRKERLRILDQIAHLNGLGNRKWPWLPVLFQRWRAFQFPVDSQGRVERLPQAD